MSIELLTFEQDGVLFFTDKATGESGLSLSGLAKLCGVDQTTVSRLIRKQFETGIEGLQEVVQQSFVLVDWRNEKTVDGVDPGNLMVYKSELCVAVIAHYASKGKKGAIFSLTKFAQMGFNTWIQGITGWEKLAQQTIAPQPNHLSSRFLLPDQIFSADDLPPEIRLQNRREMHRATEAGTQESDNCKSVGRMLSHIEPPSDDISPMTPASNLLQQKFGQS